MTGEYDPEKEAHSAMKRAASSDGVDRQRLIRLALAWHELARDWRESGAHRPPPQRPDIQSN